MLYRFANGFNEEFHSTGVKSRIFLWSEEKERCHRYDLLAMQHKAKKETLLCNSDNKKLVRWMKRYL